MEYEVRLYETIVHSLTLETQLSEEKLMQDVLVKSEAYLERAHTTDAYIDTVEIEPVGLSKQRE